MAVWHDWLAWRRTCALAACDTPTRDALQRFALKRWRHYANACAWMIHCEGKPIAIPPAAIAWHDFETWLCLRRSRRGKTYKKWLFARISSHIGDDQSLKAIQGGASLIMRDVVRERFRREMSRRGTISLNATLAGETSESLSLQELLPASNLTQDDVYQRDLAALGTATATSLSRDVLSRRAKIALLAREWGLSTTHPAVLQAAACSKSAIYKAYHDALKTIAGTVNKRFRHDDRETRASLAVATMQALKPQLLTWAKSENVMSAFF